jgi:glycosyltransferase involved in cell wall biosynthesis
LCAALAATGVKTTLLSVAAPDKGASHTSRNGYDDFRFPQDGGHIPFIQSIRKSSGLSSALANAAAGANIVHDHGLWLMPNLAAGRAASRAKKPLIVSPRGMLSPAALRFSRWRKRAIWFLGQEGMINDAACLHATSTLEHQELRELGLKNPIAVIPNGVGLPEPTLAPEQPETRIVLSLGRVHPKKGLDRLLQAWASVELNFPHWQLRIIGPAERKHDLELRRMMAELGIRRASIEGALYGEAKLAAYRGADVFVLPSLSENFGLTAAEALAASVPVIATRGTPWGGLVTEACGWWVDQGVEPLAAALKSAMGTPRAALKEMGARGRAWIENEFSWNRVACEMSNIYLWLARGGDVPSSVRFD